MLPDSILKEHRIKKRCNTSVVLESSEILGRVIRKDPWARLGKSTRRRLEEAISIGDKEEALKLTEYLHVETKDIHDLGCDWIYANLDYVAKKYGEEALPNILFNAFHKSKSFISSYNPSSVKLVDLVFMTAKSARTHRSGPNELGTSKITEDEEKYVIFLDPCGSGGRMRRGSKIDGIPARTEPPFNLGRTSKAYPWSWSKSRVPYYCVRCCIWGELAFIEKLGYPVRITGYRDDPQKPCSFIFYKDPELVPEKYFERVGKVKDPSKFRR